MPIEHVAARTVIKPWGVADPRPWTQPRCDGTSIGELWYERTSVDRTPASLLLKLLFTSQPLSIQVHPDDTFARSIGLPNGKTEAWYVIEATADAKVALGLRHSCSPQQLRRAIEDGSIADLVAWRSVSAGEVVSVPAGTIHAIGAGLVIAEIQQRSDTTFRLFDYGRQRDLHLDCAVAAANTGVGEPDAQAIHVSGQRTLLVTNQHFVLERLVLPPESNWRLEADRETWLLALSGSATIGSVEIAAGGAIYAEDETAGIRIGAVSLTCLVAYSGDVARNLLQKHTQPYADDVSTSERVLTPSPLPLDDGAATRGRKGETHEETPAYRVHWQPFAAPLRNSHLYPRSA